MILPVIAHSSFNILWNRGYMYLLWALLYLIQSLGTFLNNLEGVSPFYDRQLISWHRPYSVDLSESTFGVLKSFLENNMLGILQEQLTMPFSDTRYSELTLRNHFQT